jgi:exodeoxyribonuclease V gamma subunit
MSTLYLGFDQDCLAGNLAELLGDAMRGADLFAPVTVVVPNRYLGKWLRLWLARHLGIAINLRFQYLETAMWELLRALDARPQPWPVKMLEHDDYRLMILSVLLDDPEDKDLLPLQNYLRHGAEQAGRDFYRRCWQLADRLAGLLRDYEYHRQDALISKWLVDKDGYPRAAAGVRAVERSQAALLRRLLRQPDGMMACLSRNTQTLLRTLPQYAGEVMQLPAGQLATLAETPTIHLFGITQVSSLHIHVLRWLGGHYDLRLHHLNPLVARMETLPRSAGKTRDAMRTLADRFREALGRGQGEGGVKPAAYAAGLALTGCGEELLAAWGRAGAESLWLMAELLSGPRAFSAQLVAAAPTARPTSVLRRLQEDLLGRSPEPRDERLPQDRTLGIVACPGIFREVETIYHSIVHNLHVDPTLQQTDIAVLVTDMARYRPVIQAVFDRLPKRIVYNLADFSAAGLSTYGQALLGLLDLAQESFARSRVFAVLLNPCVLARLGVDREQGLTWLGWAEALGIYHGWDRTDKQARGYADTPLYCWRLGLQRLRLGRLMEVANEDAGLSAPQYQGVIPYADLASTDKSQLDAFCRGVEGLLPVLTSLRDRKLTGAQWAEELRRLSAAFLAIPRDRPEEEGVRDQLLQGLRRLALMDQLAFGRSPQGSAEQTGDGPPSVEALPQGERLNERSPRLLPLGLVREFVRESLECLEGTKGEYLTGGVTISALQPLRPVPFRIIYLLGMGEGNFPGTSLISTLDLRAQERCTGDIRLPESNRFLLLEATLAARQKLYVVYNSRDLQKDQQLFPCSPVNQLRRYLDQHVLRETLKVIEVPLQGSDPKFLEQPPDEDVVVNYSEAERVLAIEQARSQEKLRLDPRSAQMLDERLQRVQRAFAMPPGASAATGIPTIHLRELRGYLRCPAEAALKRHLHLRDEEEAEVQDCEPFTTGFPQDYRLVVHTLEHFVARSIARSVDDALADWRQRFADLYAEWRLRCRMPEGAFAEVDQARFERSLEERILGSQGLAEFLRSRQSMKFCGPVLLGESLTPVGARLRLPALQLVLPGDQTSTPAEARLIGTLPLVWRAGDTLDALVLTDSAEVNDKALHRLMLEPLLFFLALRAGGDETTRWLQSFELHIAHKEGIAGFAYGPEDITPDEARAYLTELVREFLDRANFDLLPFDLLVDKKELQKAYILGDNDPELGLVRAQYSGTLQDAIELDAETERLYRPMRLLEMVEVVIPEDAFDKVRRRLRLLDRGPARARQAEGGR